MGLRRMLWRSNGIGRTVDTIKNIAETGSIVDGFKKTLKEDIQDSPVTAPIYRSGKHDGMIQGYIEASGEYEKKLLEQADKFLRQAKIYEEERDAYEALLNEYEAEIEVLSEKVHRTQAENEYLQQLLLKERNLRRLVG